MAAIRHVGVIGAGLAGLAAALAAARAGRQVDLFEAQVEPAVPPAHLDVVPNLLRDLAALGLASACVRRGFPYLRFAVLDDEGRGLFEVPTPRLAGAQWPAALGLVYGDLLDLLREAVQQHGVRLHAGDAVVEVTDECTLVTARGPRVQVDFAVIASGEQMPVVGGSVPPPVPEEALPQQWCHALLPRPQGLERTAWVIGRESMRAMLVPVDERRAGVAVLRAAGAATTPAALRAALAGQGRLLGALAPHCHDGLRVLLRPVRSGLLAGDWHQHGVLRIGRSAHRLPPHFGQAAAQAVEDAVVLGALLQEGLGRRALLERFMARRGERARRVHAVTTQAARWQLHPEAATDLRALADQLAPLVAEPA